MGYSKHISTVYKIADQLQPLLARQTFFWTHEKPDWWSYKIREARSIVVQNPHLFPQLSLVFSGYQIETVTGGVLARWHGDKMPHTNVSLAEANRDVLRQTGVPTVLQSPTFEAIVQAYIDQQPNQNKIICQEVSLDNNELNALEEWGGKLIPKWVLVHVPGETTIVLGPEEAAQAVSL